MIGEKKLEEHAIERPLQAVVRPPDMDETRSASTRNILWDILPATQPLPRTGTELVLLLEKAIEAEREACARIADREEKASTRRDFSICEPINAYEEACWRIAQAVRDRTEAV